MAKMQAKKAVVVGKQTAEGKKPSVKYRVQKMNNSAAIKFGVQSIKGGMQEEEDRFK